jgi:hypothetical protein
MSQVSTDYNLTSGDVYIESDGERQLPVQTFGRSW